MRHRLLITALLICGSVGAQSKKELRAELTRKQFTIDSLQQELSFEQDQFDSLVKAYLTVENNYKRQLVIAMNAAEGYDSCRKTVAQLKEENRQLKDVAKAQQEKTSPDKEKGISKSTVPPKPKKNYDNPFLSSDSGKGDGNGHYLGKDDGNSPGKTKDTISRRVVTLPDFSIIQSDENCTIVLTVRIDEHGNIVTMPTPVAGQTTTTNKVLIQQVASLVKKQAKYNEKIGAPLVKLELKVVIKAK